MSDVIKCNYCSGKGKVRTNQGFFTVQQTCSQCGGSGEQNSNPCKNCRGLGKKQTKKNNLVKDIKNSSAKVVAMLGAGDIGVTIQEVTNQLLKTIENET